MSMTINIDGFDEVISQLHAINRKTRGQIEVAVLQAVHAGLEVCNQLTPYKTGRLRSGNKVKAITQGGEVITYALYNDVEYASYVCLGTYKMHARDFMHPAILVAQKQLRERLQAIYG